MKFVINAALISLICVVAAFATSLDITPDTHPNDVTLEKKYEFNIYTPKDDSYKSASVSGTKLPLSIVKTINQICTLTVDTSTFIKIAYKSSLNSAVTNFYVLENNKITPMKKDDLNTKLLQLVSKNLIKSDTFVYFIHGLPSDADAGQSGSLSGTGMGKSNIPPDSAAAKAMLVQTGDDNSPTAIHQAILVKTSNKCTTPGLVEFNGTFQDLPNIDPPNTIKKTVLDSKVGNIGVTVDNSNNDYTLYMVEGGFTPKHHINQVIYGPLLLDYTRTHFISLMSMKGGDNHIEIVSKHTQGFYTTIYDGETYKLDLAIPRRAELPMPIQGKYIILDVINPNIRDMSDHFNVNIYPEYLLYNIFDSDTTVDVRCLNVDVYLSAEEKQRQVHIKFNQKELSNVTITSMINGNQLVRSFQSDGLLYVFTDY